VDIARPDQARKRRRKRIIYSIASLCVLALITIGLSQLKPAVPLVENTYKGTVKRGQMLRQVRGNGALVPQEIRWIPAANQGRVENILVLVGSAVKVDTILVELSDPVLEQAAFDAKYQVKAAEAELANLRVQVASQRLTQQAIAASAQANFNNAKLDSEVNEELSKSGLVPGLILKQSRARAEELGKLNEIEQERLRMNPESANAQLAAQEAKLEQMRALYELKRQQVEALKVRAGIEGVLQKLGDTAPLQIGQQVAAGVNLARVANPTKLKAEIKIAETQARDVTFDQRAIIDTRNGFIPGHIIRIDPSAQNGTRTVDVALDGPLPKGAVPDLSVDGTIELERLEDVLYVERPIQGQADSTVGIFKVVDGGKAAVRVPVKLGRTSVSTVEVVDGLQVGDQVILSDMSQWDAHDRVRLN
jgi:HlyD family secretion protein